MKYLGDRNSLLQRPQDGIESLRILIGNMLLNP